MTKNTKSNWELPTTKPDIRQEEQLAWEKNVTALAELASANGWGKRETANYADIPEGTFSSWFSGKYGNSTNNITEKVQRFLISHDDALKVDDRIFKAPHYTPTRSSTEIIEALREAKQLSELALITTVPGLGKTIAAEEWKRITPNVYLVTMFPSCATVHGMLVELCTELGITQNDASKRVRAIGEFFKSKRTKCQLIVDEAQNLTDQAVDQLRHFSDKYGVSVVLMGNEVFYGKWGQSIQSMKDGQFSRRVSNRVQIKQAHRDDITILLDAWKIKDDDCRRLLASIGQKAGTLGQMVKTIEKASLAAIGAGKPLNVDLIAKAWERRSGEKFAK